MKYLTLLGSTGSIGSNTLDIVRHNPDCYAVVALVANKNVQRMIEQCLEFSPRYAVMHDKNSAYQVKTFLEETKNCTEVLSGQQASCEMAALDDIDQVISAISGTDGLFPTLSAINARKTVLLANKESLVMCGNLLVTRAKECGAYIIPVDSEHNAIFKMLPLSLQKNLGFINLEHNGIASIILTGSGGPFRETPLSMLNRVTPEQACCHPNWVMGKKISIDSATMMNKGLEYIIAKCLFNTSLQQIEVLIHPQSVIHSMVRYSDGNILAQLSIPDMRIPIAYSMAWPKQCNLSSKKKFQSLDFIKLNLLTFFAPDYNRYPCLELAIETSKLGQAAVIALNAANEITVSAFLNYQIRFTEIAIINQLVVEKMVLTEPKNINEVLEIDTKAREITKQLITHFIDR